MQIFGRNWLASFDHIIARVCLCVCFALFSLGTYAAIPVQTSNALLLNLSGSIGPAADSYIEQGIHQAVVNKSKLIILQLNTPGGLEKSMRSIIGKILSSPIPIVTYVAPSGAQAASAGTFILYASHVAAMAPGTNVGAATPVSLYGSENEPKNSSVLTKEANDASAYIRSLAQLRQRNSDWGVKAVLQGVSVSANEALQLHVIDFVAVDIPDLMAKVNGKTVSVLNKPVVLNTQATQVVSMPPDWRARFLAIITDPNIAYILLLVGIYGLIFEFLNPGFILPGVAGLISLLLALYAFQLLPINYVGLALIFLGVAFLIAEVFLPTFGTIGIGGIIAFVIGSILLFNHQVPGFTLFLAVIIAVTVVTTAYLLFIVQLAVRAHRRPVVSGREELIGSTGRILFLGDKKSTFIRIRGELWQVRSNHQLYEGQVVRVIGIDELILTVVPDEATSNQGEART